MMTPSSRPRPVLLAHSFFLRHDEKQRARMRPYAPLATLIAAAWLREQGVAVQLFDAMLSDGVHEFEQMLDEASPDIVAIVEDNFNFITKMCTARMRADALAMVRLAHARGCRVIVNGSDAVDHPDRYLEAGADAVIVGEVEPVLGDVVCAMHAGDSLQSVPGLVLAAGGASVRTGVRPYHSSLDHLPQPAWDLVDVDAYHSAWRAAHGRTSWSMVTSRGCPYGCNWCAKPLWGRRYAQRSAHLVADELVALRTVVAPDHVWFGDDIFGITPGWLESFADEVEARDVRTPFMMQSRANLMMPRTTAALARAGAEEVWLGVESGAQHVLDAMEKGTTIAQIRAATESLRNERIRVGWFVMLGYPGEEWEDILRTRDLIRELRPDDIGVSVAYPLPGTAFHRTVQAQLGPQRNWRETDELAVLFDGAYTTTFYRSVRDLLHREVLEGRTFDAEWDLLAQRRRGARIAAPGALAGD